MNRPAVSQITSERLDDRTIENSILSDASDTRVVPAPGLFLMTDSFQTGGSERQFLELVRGLQPTAYRVLVGCLQEKGPLRKEHGAVELFHLGGSLYRLPSMQARFRLATYLRRRQTAIAHAFDYYTNLALIPAAKLAGTPVVIGSQRQLGDLLTPAQRWSQLAMFRWADCVVCNSRAAADRLIKQGLRADKLRVIGNGLPPAAFAELVPVSARRPGIQIGMIARMNTLSKNHRLLLRVAARLKNRFQKFELILVGDGPLRAELEREAEELGVAQLVQFLGDRRDVRAILASLDVTVLPSASESLSNAILESMAAGVPVIASDVGGNPELVSKDTGILVPPDDEEALEAALLRLAGDAPLREALGQNAKSFAREHFTIEQMVKGHDQLYAELLERKGWNAKFKHAGPRKSSPDLLRVSIIGASLRYVGGQSVQADLLLKHWQNDPDVHAEFIPIDPDFPRVIRWAEKIPGLRTVLREPLYVLTLWRGMKNVDVAHIFSASYWSFLLAPVPAWLLARLRKRKVLLHYHSGEARDHMQRFPASRAMLRKMDMLVVPSGYLVDVFREFGMQAEVVPNIFDLSQFKFRSRNPLRPHLVCTRGFHPYYRVDLVVHAFAKVQRIFPEAQLDLAGSGPIEAQIRELVQKLNLSGVRFLGVIPRDAIGSVYNHADIFVNASSVDNMPVSILEAFASGTPVVSTAPEGIRYLVEHERTGLLSRPEDPEPLGENILRLLRDRDLGGRMAASAYEESHRYRWNAVREQWLARYRALTSASLSHESSTQLKAGGE